MRWRLVLLICAPACAASESERATQRAERRQAREAVMAGEVVQSSRTPTTAGRLIYEPPADLSYDSLLVKRPDLVRADESRRR